MDFTEGKAVATKLYDCQFLWEGPLAVSEGGEGLESLWTVPLGWRLERLPGGGSMGAEAGGRVSCVQEMSK
jgi:hypothetical protein